MNETYIVYTDGACSGNPGPGGWAAIVVGEEEQVYTGFQANTTNNRMELAAVGEILRVLPDGAAVDIHTDSQNVIKWLTGEYKRKDPTIRRLCEEIDDYVREHNQTLMFNKVKGHADNRLNNKADELAVKACRDGMAKNR